ncbi:MAG: apiosidase-like domain-containing protein [Alphaproteobacteria bacterium]
MKRSWIVMLALWMAGMGLLPCHAAGHTAEHWRVFETSFESSGKHENPFMDVRVNVVFQKDGTEWKQPAFWNGGSTWTVRFAFPETGTFTWRVESNDPSLSKQKGTVEVGAYTGTNPLIKHGHLRVAANKRYFEHADGTPFLWMGDTWWKCLSKRISFDEFKELTDDRKEKGFSLVQIVCGPYPDEDFFTDWWDNEGGKPYLNRNFTEINLEYWKYSDRRFDYLIQSGIVPAIVGAWGRHDCDAMRHIGTAGMKRHWRELIARYGAYPTVWIVGGEASGKTWSETARYVMETDPFARPVSVHGDPGKSVRQSVGADNVNFDFLQTGHGRTGEDYNAINRLIASYKVEPRMPALISEHSYEEHMKAGPPYTQRFVFWGSMLSGGAGLTYGAAGIWHAGIEGFPASVNTYDFTTWRQGMVYPGSAQMGLNARFLRNYPWEKFEVHHEWGRGGMFAAGIPGEIRMLYFPRPPAYQWEGFKVFHLEKNVPYKTFFFDPSTGRTFDQPAAMYTDAAQTVFEDDFSAGRTSWKDEGPASSIEGGRLVTQKGALTILQKDFPDYLTVSADITSGAEAGIVVNYTDEKNYLVGIYSGGKLFFHHQVEGKVRQLLGGGAGPLTRGPRVLRNLPKELTMSVTVQEGVATVRMQGGAMDLASTVEVGAMKPGRVGLWQGGASAPQHYDNFKVVNVPDRKPGICYLTDPTLNIERVPSPQDWVLVMEKEEQ